VQSESRHRTRHRICATRPVSSFVPRLRFLQLRRASAAQAWGGPHHRLRRGGLL